MVYYWLLGGAAIGELSGVQSTSQKAWRRCASGVGYVANETHFFMRSVVVPSFLAISLLDMF
jgi:hypothetical protein